MYGDELATEFSSPDIMVECFGPLLGCMIKFALIVRDNRCLRLSLETSRSGDQGGLSLCSSRQRQQQARAQTC